MIEDKLKNRLAFEAYMANVQLVSYEDLEWNEARNCYREWPVHFAWQAWCYAQGLYADSVTP